MRERKNENDLSNRDKNFKQSSNKGECRLRFTRGGPQGRTVSIEKLRLIYQKTYWLNQLGAARDQLTLPGGKTLWVSTKFCRKHDLPVYSVAGWHGFERNLLTTPPPPLSPQKRKKTIFNLGYQVNNTTTKVPYHTKWTLFMKWAFILLRISSAPWVKWNVNFLDLNFHGLTPNSHCTSVIPDMTRKNEYFSPSFSRRSSKCPDFFVY